MLNIEMNKGCAVVAIDNGKVNAINTALSRKLKATFQELKEDEKVKGAILTGRPHCFSAGLDVMELATLEGEEGKEFWRQYLGAMRALAAFPKPLVCGITGYAPAGATIFTLCTDYRVMGKGAKHVIGMNEFNMSMQIPKPLCEVFIYHLGEVKAWKAVQSAKLFNSDEALAYGLVDESVEVEQVMERAEKQVRKMMMVYPAVFKESKSIFRKGLLEIVAKDIETAVDDIFRFQESDPMFKQMTQMFLASLKK